MRLPDTNLLLNAVHADAPQHAEARQSLEAVMNDPHGMALTWVALLGFVRLSSRRGILPLPLGVADALSVIEGWLTQPRARIVDAGPLHAAIWGRLLREAGTGGNLSTDAHIAAIAIEHNCEVLTFDKDFARFSGLRYRLLG